MQVPFGMAIENMELVHECYPEYLAHGKVRLKYERNRERRQEDKSRK